MPRCTICNANHFGAVTRHIRCFTMINMRNVVLPLVLSLPLVACMVGGGTTGGDDIAPGDDAGVVTCDGITGKITANTTWMGTVNIIGNTSVETGVTVTIAAGTTVKVKDGVLITVNGILDAQGTSASKITIAPAGFSFGGVTV